MQGSLREKGRGMSQESHHTSQWGVPWSPNEEVDVLRMLDSKLEKLDEELNQWDQVLPESWNQGNP